jgi:hypothetical protein
MKATELRIGNYLQGDPVSIPKFNYSSDGVTQITAFGIQMIEEGKLTFEPIPLTEKWLTDFGFTGDEGHVIKDISQNKFRPLKIIINLNGEGGIYISAWDEDDEVVLYEGSQYFIHQLQNLIHALTGEELILTPSAKGE